MFLNKPVTVKTPGGEVLEGTITGTFGKSGKQKVLLKEPAQGAALEGLAQGEVELRIKVYSKEIAKLKNKH